MHTTSVIELRKCGTPLWRLLVRALKHALHSENSRSRCHV